MTIDVIAAAAPITIFGGDASWSAAPARTISALDARIVAIDIPGASAISPIGTFLNVPPPKVVPIRSDGP